MSKEEAELLTNMFFGKTYKKEFDRLCKLEKWIKQQYEDTYTLISLPATKEKKKEYEIRCKVYEDILDKLKEK